MGATQLTPAHQSLLDAMPENVTIDVNGFGPVFFSHATPRDDEEVVLVDTRLDRWSEVYRDLPSEIETVVCGHTHMPFARLVHGRMVVNPGSVGLPYGRVGAHWAILEGGSVTLSRTRIETDDLIREVAAVSTMPGAAAWLEESLRQPTSDADVIAAFGPRDGR